MIKTYQVTLSYEVASDTPERVWEGADNIAKIMSHEFGNSFEVSSVQEIDEAEAMW